MLWIAKSYGLALLALAGALLAAAALAAVVRFSLFQVLFFLVPAVICYIVGRTYRHGMALGAPRLRLLLLGLVFSGLILGALSVYLGYATVSWILYQGQPGPKISGFWQYLANPGEVRTLYIARAQDDQNGIDVNLHFACGLGAVLGFAAVAAGLRDTGKWKTPAVGDPAAFLDQTVIDTTSRLGQRLTGLFLAVLAGAALAMVWHAPGRDLAIPGFVIPVALVFGLGLMARPSRPAGWMIVSALAFAAAFVNCWLLSTL